MKTHCTLQTGHNLRVTVYCWGGHCRLFMEEKWWPILMNELFGFGWLFNRKMSLMTNFWVCESHVQLSNLSYIACNLRRWWGGVVVSSGGVLPGDISWPSYVIQQCTQLSPWRPATEIILFARIYRGHNNHLHLVTQQQPAAAHRACVTKVTK